MPRRPSITILPSVGTPDPAVLVPDVLRFIEKRMTQEKPHDARRVRQRGTPPTRIVDAGLS